MDKLNPMDLHRTHPSKQNGKTFFSNRINQAQKLTMYLAVVGSLHNGAQWSTPLSNLTLWFSPSGDWLDFMIAF